MSELVVGRSTVTTAAPPKAKKAPYLRDADGNVYVWTEALASRGDLVSAYDPDAPEQFAEDEKQIRLNRELEIAREKANMEEAARLEAVRDAELARAKVTEQEMLAKANAKRAEDVERALQAEREQHAMEMAKLKAEMEALAKAQVSNTPVVGEEPKAPAKKATPRKKAPAQKVTQEGASSTEETTQVDAEVPTSDLSDFDS